MSQLFANDFTPEFSNVKLRVAVRQNPQSNLNARAPKVKGYVIVNKQQAANLLALCEASDTGTVTMQLALWDDPTNDKYPMSGNIDINTFDRAATEAETHSHNPPNKSIFY